MTLNVDGLVKSQNFKLLPHHIVVVVSRSTQYIAVVNSPADFLRDHQR